MINESSTFGSQLQTAESLSKGYLDQLNYKNLGAQKREGVAVVQLIWLFIIVKFEMYYHPGIS